MKGSGTVNMTTLYRRGADFERSVRARLVNDGWTVARCAGSKGGGGVDLIAWRSGGRPRRIVALQCKRDGRVDPVERRKMLLGVNGLTDEVYVVRAAINNVRRLDEWNGNQWEPWDNVL